MFEDPRNRGWAADREAVAQRRSHARQLVGGTIESVTYVDLDYNGWQRGHRDLTVAREVTDSAEWAHPTWMAGGFHSVDHAIEFRTVSGSVWTVTWDPPGDTESLSVFQGQLGLAGARWDVSHVVPWSSMFGPVTDVKLKFGELTSPTADGFWCTCVTIETGGGAVDVVFADDQDGKPTRSADNLGVFWTPGSTPAWGDPANPV